jgi:hypothetical protein
MLEAFAQSGKQRPVILAYTRKDEGNVDFHNELSKHPRDDWEEMIAQQKLAESFIREQFKDASHLRRIRRLNQRHAMMQRGQLPTKIANLPLKRRMARRRTQFNRCRKSPHLSLHFTRFGFQPLVFCVHP